MIPTSITLDMPHWLADALAAWPEPFATAEQRMRFVLALAQRNIEAGTGGPFAAAVFVRETQQLVAVGVNRVVPAHASIAHAEMMALALAQQATGGYDLGADPSHTYELVSSCEPCAMCFGALPWSGIRHLLCGAHAADARAIGFDEGPRHPAWVAELARRGITVQRSVLRAEAAAQLRRYASAGGAIYNGSQG